MISTLMAVQCMCIRNSFTQAGMKINSIGKHSLKPNYIYSAVNADFESYLEEKNDDERKGLSMNRNQAGFVCIQLLLMRHFKLNLFCVRGQIVWNVFLMHYCQSSVMFSWGKYWNVSVN